jgi:hypothetical protein
MFRTINDNWPEHPDRESSDHRHKQFFRRIKRIKNPSWHPFDGDRRNTSTRGLFTTSHDSFRALLTLEGDGPAYSLRLRVQAGPMQPDWQKTLLLAVQLQSAPGFTRLVVDFETKLISVEAIGFLCETCSPEQIIGLLIREIRRTLEDERLRAMIAA